jgi:hypothetical protein
VVDHCGRTRSGLLNRCQALSVIVLECTSDTGIVDAFLNASMILSGMGPVDRMTTAASKLFAALYALFSGLVFVGVIGVRTITLLHPGSTIASSLVHQAGRKLLATGSLAFAGQTEPGLRSPREIRLSPGSERRYR